MSMGSSQMHWQHSLFVGRRAERVNDFAAPFVMNLLRRLVVISVRRSPEVVG